MPGFDRTGPMGMGSMTGGARGLCSPRGMLQTGPGAAGGRGGGRGRGNRNMYWATGLPGWRRPFPGAFSGTPFTFPATEEQETGFLKNQAEALKAELDAVNARLQEIESGDR